MADKKQSVWQTLVAVRWPLWKIEGDGPFAVVDESSGVVRLHVWLLGAQVDRREAPWTRSLIRLEHVPVTSLVKLPGDSERD